MIDYPDEIAHRRYLAATIGKNVKQAKCILEFALQSYAENKPENAAAAIGSALISMKLATETAKFLEDAMSHDCEVSLIDEMEKN